MRIKICLRFLARLTGKFEITLMPNALRIPQMRKAKFDWEYLIPHIGLFRISSALNRKKILSFELFNFLTFDDNEYKS